VNTPNKTAALVVTLALAVCLVGVMAAIVVLLIGQHTVPAVAIGLITTLGALLVPSPLGHAISVPASGAIKDLLSGASFGDLLNSAPAPSPVPSPTSITLPVVDLTGPATPPPPAPAPVAAPATEPPPLTNSALLTGPA